MSFSQLCPGHFLQNQITSLDTLFKTTTAFGAGGKAQQVRARLGGVESGRAPTWPPKGQLEGRELFSWREQKCVTVAGRSPIGASNPSLKKGHWEILHLFFPSSCHTFSLSCLQSRREREIH